MRCLICTIFALSAVLACGATPVVLSMQECIAYGLEHSPTLANQKLTVENQKLQTVIEAARFAFQLSGSNTHAARAGTDVANLTLSKEFESGFAVSTWVNTLRANGQGFDPTYVAVQVSKTLLGGGSRLATTYDWQASMVNELIEMNGYNRQRRKLSQDIRIAYYNVILAVEALKVKETALENAQKNLKNTREREKPLDILTAEAKIPEYEMAVNTAKRTISNGLDSLKQLIGMPMETPFDIKRDFKYAVRKINLTQDLEFARGNLETLLNNRLERRKLEWQVKIGEEKLIPEVAIAGTYYKYVDGEINGRKDEETVTLNFSWELGRRSFYSQLGIYRNRMSMNQNTYYSLNQELTNDMTSYLRRLQESAAAVTLQERLCEIQRRKDALYKDKWENGEIDILEVVRTQTALEEAYVTLITRKINYLELLANYDYTMGK